MVYSFKNDYSESVHPRLLQAIFDTNMEQDEGYGLDRHTVAAAEIIRTLLGPAGQDAAIHFLSGGTQTNAVALAAFLRPHEAVIASDSAHICVHETGAIEATGHKIVAVPTCNEKLRPEDVLQVLVAHQDEHMVKPRLVKISQPTEMGLVYSQAELTALHTLCREKGLLLYVDGARLGSALTCDCNDVDLAGLCNLADAFYIGGTKNGALLGEALVIVNPLLHADFRYILKQRGGMLAKGRVVGVQFKELFSSGLYLELASHANRMAGELRKGISQAGYVFLTNSPTNQIFPVLPNGLVRQLEKRWSFYVWQKMDEHNSAIRLVTSWATQEAKVFSLVQEIQAYPRNGFH